MTSGYGALRRVSIYFGLAIFLAGCAAQTRYQPSPVTVTIIDRLDALDALDNSLNGTPRSYGDLNCINADGQMTYLITGDAVEFSCSNGVRQTIAFRDAPTPELVVGEYLSVVVRLFEGESKQRTALTQFFTSTATAAQFADAWYVLARPRALQDPTADAAFLSGVQAYRAEPQAHSEALRRTQVQAETALKENRPLRAAMLYRDALKVAAGWPEGHFNLALLYGDAGLHTDAINAMRRYLYLVPGAPDARAAQDKIYEWELKAK